ncbi:MAG: NTP transferase domain-containing protein [Bacteroidia bacterium]
MKKITCAVIILAGGKSERMNFPKPFLDFDGRTFMEKISDEYFEAGISKIVLVLNEEFTKGKWRKYLDKTLPVFDVVENSNPQMGRFHSLKLGLKKVKEDDFCFIQNIDNPFVTKNVILNLWNHKFEDGFVSPVFKGQGGHPVLISKNVIQALDQLKDEDVILKEKLKEFPKKELEVQDEAVLININTREEYRTFVHDEIDV